MINTLSVFQKYILIFLNCRNLFQCLRQYLVISIREGHLPVTCPDADCPISGTILVTEVFMKQLNCALKNSACNHK